MSAAAQPGCTCGKRLWSTAVDAGRALVNAKIRHRLRGDQRRREQRSYPCPSGTGWHLTSLDEITAPQVRHDPGDDDAAHAFIDRHLDTPVGDIVWQQLLQPAYARQTERVLAAMLRRLQADMASRKAEVESARGGDSGDARAAYRAWSVRAMERQAQLAARRREIGPAIRAVNVDENESNNRSRSRRHREVLRRLTLAVQRHRADTHQPTDTDRQLWAWLDVLTVPNGDGATSLADMLERWERT